MRTIITVSKAELTNRDKVVDIIKQISSGMSEVGDVYTFSPRPGKLFELLTLLRNNNIKYGTDFNISEDHQSS